MKKNNLITFFQKRAKAAAKYLVLILTVVFAFFPYNPVQAGSLKTVKDTVSTSRPSVSTAIGSAITAGDTTINVASTAGIQASDSIKICNSGCTTTENRVVTSVLSSTQLALTAGTTNSYATGTVYYKSTAVHTITFTTNSGVASGNFLVSFPADASTFNNALPDSTGFDFNSILTSDVSMSCGGCTVGTIATSSGSSLINFTIPFTTGVASNTPITITIGSTNKLLSPTKSAASGTADTWSVTITERDGSSNTIDSSSIRIATIESVAVTATVTPSLSFTINPVNSGTSVAGKSTDVTSTAVSVPFGTLTTGVAKHIAQYLAVYTNADSGYIVTAQEDGSMRKSTGTTIPDLSATPADNDANDGFGFSLANKTGTDATSNLVYNFGGATFQSRSFPTSTPVQIMSNSGAITTKEVYVVYRLRVPQTQPPGDYSNLVTYIATATY